MAYPHFQPAQTNSLRLLNKRHAMELEGSRGAPGKRRSKSWYSSFMDVAHRFASRSTVHGVNRLLHESSGRFERCLVFSTIWLCAIILAISGATYVCLILSDRFTEGKFETVIDTTRRPVYRVYFPTITICNQNRLNWQRLKEAKKLFLTGNKSEPIQQIFESVIGAYDDLSFGKFKHFRELQSLDLDKVNYVNFSQVFDFMTWRCEEFLINCIWRHLNMSCCEIFSKRRSKNGPCWSFNTLETEEGKRMESLDPKWPWRTGGAGPTSGLTLRALINPEKHYPKNKNEKGLTVMVTEPYVWHKDPAVVPENTHTVLQFEPVINYYDNETRTVSTEQRQCVFQDEYNSDDYKSLPGYIYMFENCQAQCHQQYLLRYCNCTIDLLFPPGPYRSCKATDLPCLGRNYDFFLYTHQPLEEKFLKNDFHGMNCKCFRNCHSLNYFNDIRPTYLTPEVRKNISFVDLDIHFRYETFLVYRTSLVFGWVDLLVAFGGIAGLFLGCSLISGVELLYFVAIDIPVFIVRKLLQHRKRLDTTATQQKFGISNRMLAADRYNQEQYVIKSSPNVAIMRVQPKNDMQWLPQKINRQLIQVNE